MSLFCTIWRREVASFFLMPASYAVVTFFLALMGLSFWLMVQMLMLGHVATPVSQVMFGESLFFWMAMLMVPPLITMRCVAEERRIGTMELLMTAPVGDATVALGKFAGALTVFLLLWIPTLSYVFYLSKLAPYATPLDVGALAGAYVGIGLIGAFFLSIGLFASTCTRNQMVAAISSFSLIAMYFFMGFTPRFTELPLLHQSAHYISCLTHMIDFSRGVLDSRPVVLYLSLTALMLFIER